MSRPDRDPEDPAPPAGFFMSAIGVVRSPFVEAFGVPRQPGLAPVRARVELDARVISPEALRGLETVTHVWLLFVFHRADPAQTHPTVRPPRLGGNTRMGVFATRSPQRPNPLGLSVVRLVGVQGHTLTVEGVDLLDGTPVLDIKPYVAEVDRVDGSAVGWLPPPEPPRAVAFTPQAAAAIDGTPDAARLRAEIVGLLQLDPRPSHRRGDDDDPHGYGMALGRFDVRFEVRAGVVVVLALRERTNDDGAASPDGATAP